MLFTQCNKREIIIPQDGETVNITLDAGDNSKVIVNPNATPYATVSYEENDVIYVGYNGKYVGQLICNANGKFAGTLTINESETPQPLHFYFLGNKCTTTELIPNITTTLTADISDQSSKLPVISYAPSTINYSSGVTKYKAKLRNKCALVKFCVSGYTGSGTVSITSMNNKVTLALDDSTFSYDKVTNDGVITFNNKSDGEYWLILLPQSAVADGNAYSSDGWSGTFGNVPAITDNAYLTDAITVTLTKPVFSVSTVTTVEFAPGNLYYDDSESKWKFEANQWDYRTWGNRASVIGGISTTSQGDWGLFGWSGDTGSAYGMSTSSSVYSYSGKFNDWGGITDLPDNDSGKTWRTLSRLEWVYLLGTVYSSPCRNKATELRAWKELDDGKYKGLVILPDGAESSVMSSITSTSDLASHGAVFLPAAGYRYEPDVNEVGSYGYYWTSDPGVQGAYRMYFNSDFALSGYSDRYYGYSVRLVRAAR